MKTLFLAWQDRPRTRQWFPVGRLDASTDHYRFRYIRGAERAQRETGFQPLVDFPEFRKNYEASELFPLFKNRVLGKGRRDFHDYLQQLDLPDQADPIEILTVDGGYRATDSFEVFPLIDKRPDGSFRSRFFLHGWRHVNDAAKERLKKLVPGEELYVTFEMTNPAAGFAIQIQTTDYHMIGWAPRYLVQDLLHAMTESGGEYGASVVRLNPVPAPSKQRLLIELRGNWRDHRPMSTNDYIPLID